MTSFLHRESYELPRSILLQVHLTGRSFFILLRLARVFGKTLERNGAVADKSNQYEKKKQWKDCTAAGGKDHHDGEGKEHVLPGFLFDRAAREFRERVILDLAHHEQGEHDHERRKQHRHTAEALDVLPETENE